MTMLRLPCPLLRVMRLEEFLPPQFQCHPSALPSIAPTPALHARRFATPSSAHPDRYIGAPMPWRLATFHHLLKHLSVPERVHGPPKTFIAIDHKLPTVDEALEWFIDQLVALLKIVEDFSAEDEIPAVDPDLGTTARAHCANNAALIEINQMKGERRVYGHEATFHAASFEPINHIG